MKTFVQLKMCLYFMYIKRDCMRNLAKH